jgi:hypothetical protein
MSEIDIVEFLLKQAFRVLKGDEATHPTGGESVEQLRRELAAERGRWRRAEATAGEATALREKALDAMKRLECERDVARDERDGSFQLLGEAREEGEAINSAFIEALADARKWLGRASIYVTDEAFIRWIEAGPRE